MAKKGHVVVRGAKLDELIQATSTTREQLSFESGISQNTILKMLRSQVVQRTKLAKVAQSIGVADAELIHSYEYMAYLLLAFRRTVMETLHTIKNEHGWDRVRLFLFPKLKDRRGEPTRMCGFAEIGGTDSPFARTTVDLIDDAPSRFSILGDHACVEFEKPETSSFIELARIARRGSQRVTEKNVSALKMIAWDLPELQREQLTNWVDIPLRVNGSTVGKVTADCYWTSQSQYHGGDLSIGNINWGLIDQMTKTVGKAREGGFMAPEPQGGATDQALSQATRYKSLQAQVGSILSSLRKSTVFDRVRCYLQTNVFLSLFGELADSLGWKVIVDKIEYSINDSLSDQLFIGFIEVGGVESLFEKVGIPREDNASRILWGKETDDIEKPYHQRLWKGLPVIFTESRESEVDVRCHTRPFTPDPLGRALPVLKKLGERRYLGEHVDIGIFFQTGTERELIGKLTMDCKWTHPDQIPREVFESTGTIQEHAERISEAIDSARLENISAKDLSSFLDIDRTVPFS